ncbi:MAG: hypothetical protein LKI24_02045 [Acidipropionibacterium sp.]|nr:hypothetical protein [Acidipropionibacterium sp.]
MADFITMHSTSTALSTGIPTHHNDETPLPPRDASSTLGASLWCPGWV